MISPTAPIEKKQTGVSQLFQPVLPYFRHLYITAGTASSSASSQRTYPAENRPHHSFSFSAAEERE
jgi:hypothetical protein